MEHGQQLPQTEGRHKCPELSWWGGTEVGGLGYKPVGQQHLQEHEGSWVGC